MRLVPLTFLLLAAGLSFLTAPAPAASLTNSLNQTGSEVQSRHLATLSSIAQQAYLKASNTDSSDLFGRSVAISGDTVVIGAVGEASNATGVNGDQADNSASTAGAAYVLVRSGNVWTQQAYLKASNTEADDWFGNSVAISNDTIVVGAVMEDSNATGVNGDQVDNNAPSSGAAYVFVRNGDVWTQQAYLKASNTEEFDFFGNSVAISDDTIVVGAVQEDSNATGVNGNQADNNAPGSGAAYVFFRSSGGVWTQQAYLKASNTDGADNFGISVAISNETIVVGALGEDSNATGVDGDQADNNAPDSGAAYCFIRTGSVWTQQAYLKASNTDANDLFGFVAISDDTIVVGARGEGSNARGVDGDQADNSASASGAAYVFARADGLWTQQAYLKASNTETLDLFGGSMTAISGDTVVIGATGEDSNATGIDGDQSDNNAPTSGAAYFFARTNDIWAQHTYLKASNTDSGDPFGDFFGRSVATSGGTTVIGASFEDSAAFGIDGDQMDNSASAAGATYVFVATPPPTLGNISTRLQVQTGDNVLIGGVIITGTELKNTLLRAIGPSLPLGGSLADPSLELFDDTGTLIASNDNWNDAPNRQEIIDSTIPPTNDFESAILMPLEPGAYTAVMRGVNNTTGIGLVEGYDLDQSVDSQLANISTRGFVQSGDDVMIGGFIILGIDPQNVIVRAIGPSLPVAGQLADPVLELFDSNGALLASNDDWRSDQESEIIDTGIPPTNDLESAIVATLPPEAYTAIIRGKNDTIGVGLVEVFQLD